jgi:membrane protease YdiL (CAAX protease family)
MGLGNSDIQRFLVRGTIVSVTLMVALAWILRGNALWKDLAGFPGWFNLLAGPALGTCTALSSAILYARIPRLRRVMPAEILAMVRRMPTGVWLFAAVSGSVAEEIFFRGALQPLVGIVITNLLFGFFHYWAQRRLVGYGAAAFLMGLLLSTVYVWTGSLLTVSLMHVTHNLVVSAWIIRSRRFTGYLDAMDDEDGFSEGQ